jgi:dihydrofolate reductase
MTRLHLIFARSSNGVIGNKGALPWHLPEDLAHFKRTTQGAPVIMGRKTWDSLPARFKPLPNRTNIVITRQIGWSEPGALRANDIESASRLCPGVLDAWVIGGAELYGLAVPFASTAVITEVDLQVEGDAFAPEFGSDWKEVSREPQVAKNGIAFSIVKLVKN